MQTDSLAAPDPKSGSGETVYKKFGAAGMLEAPIRSLHFNVMRTFQKIRGLRLGHSNW